MLIARFKLLFILTMALTCCAITGLTSASTQQTSAKASANAPPPTSVIVSENPVDSEENADAQIDLPDESVPIVQKDPLEKFNRAMYGFNDFFDTYMLKPVSAFYSKVVPKPLAKGISNVFSNIDMVPTVLNDLLMGNFYQATSDVWRLGINTTLGIGGLFDVASPMGLEPNTEDFGLTLARWGWTNSTYIVIPFMGPSTLRDGLIGWPVNYYALSVYPHIKPTRLQWAIYGLNVVSRRADLLHYQEVMESVVIDKYAFMRSAYLQRRQYLINRNKELDNPYTGKDNLETPTTERQENEAVVQTKPFSNI